MFTGLIQRVGRFQGLRRAAGGWSLACAHEPWETALETGESVAVQGACLTVTGAGAGLFHADVLDETLACTTLGALADGAPVNLERALRLCDRLGGHWVTGHVDARGTLAAIRRRGRDRVLRVRCPRDLARQTARKGSVALDGVSLTVSEAGEEWFEVNVIPHTWEATSLAARAAGDAVNVEGDILAKYVEKLRGRPDAVTEDLLRRSGFMA